MKLADCAAAVVERRPFRGSNCWGEAATNGYVVWCRVTTRERGRELETEWPIVVAKFNPETGMHRWGRLGSASYLTSGRDQRRITTLLSRVVYRCDAMLLSALMEMAHSVVHGEATAKWADL